MSVTLARAEEVLMEKMKAYSVENNFTFEEDQDSIGEIYADLCWGDFTEKTGVTQVEEWGGEDEGSSIGYTVKFDVDGETIYLKITGYYDSWNGTDWDDGTVRLVKPVERMVTFYE